MTAASTTGSEIGEAARRTPGVTEALPLIEQPLMASANGRVEGVLVRGNATQGPAQQPDHQPAM